MPQTDYKTVRSVKTVRMSCFVVIKMETYHSQFLTTLDRLFVLRLITKICPHKKYCSKTPKHTQNSSLLRNRMQMKISISETGIATWYLWSLQTIVFYDNLKPSYFGLIGFQGHFDWSTLRRLRLIKVTKFCYCDTTVSVTWMSRMLESALNPPLKLKERLLYEQGVAF